MVAKVQSSAGKSTTGRQLGEVLREVRATKSAAQKLEPLLQLVEEQPEGEDSPIEQLQIVLEAILLGQRELDRKLGILLAEH